jgi:hypothetical protein
MKRYCKGYMMCKRKEKEWLGKVRKNVGGVPP